MKNKRETFVVFYVVGNDIRTKNIISTIDECDKDANKVSKKWADVYSKKYLDELDKKTRK